MSKPIPRGAARMSRIVLNSSVKSDGTLHLVLPASTAGQAVQVTVESVSATKPMTQDEWRAWVQAMAGSWEGEFERMPQGEYERREPLS